MAFDPKDNLGEHRNGRWKPGESGNPGGKPKGTRNKICGDFLHALNEDFTAHGKEAIARCREENPAQYVKVIALLLPKEVEIKRPLQEMEDAELIAAVTALQSYLATRAAAGGDGEAPGGESVN